MPRLPDDTERLFILGKTGGGKSQAGFWHLAQRSWDRMPWTVFDFKDDRTLAHVIPHKQIELGQVPHRPGIYRVVAFSHEKERIDDHLWRIHEQGNHGIFIDEGLQVAGLSSVDAINKQGRSKHIPVIFLYQRPVGARNVSVISESEFMQVFHLKKSSDRDVVADTLPERYKAMAYERLPKYHSLWVDDNAETVTRLAPVPPIERIMALFQAKQDTLEKGYPSEYRGRFVIV